LQGLKENVIVGHKIPAGTGLKKYGEMVVGSKIQLAALTSSKAQQSQEESLEVEEVTETITD